VICEFLVDGKCEFTAKLVGVSLKTADEVCQHCLSSDKPKELNRATCSLMAGHLLTTKQFNEANPTHVAIREILTVPLSGVGTELKKRIAWFPIPNKTKCRSCKNLEAKMNRWGPDVCEAKISYIIGKLRIAAKRRGIPFFELVVMEMVYSSIRSERERLC